MNDEKRGAGGVLRFAGNRASTQRWQRFRWGNYTYKIEKADDKTTGMEALNRRRARVAYSYQPQNEDELHLEVSDLIEVLEEVEEGCANPSTGVVSEFNADKPDPSVDVTGAFFLAALSRHPKGSLLRGDHLSSSAAEIKPKPVVKGIGFGNIFPESRIKAKQQGSEPPNDKRGTVPLKKPAPPVPSDASSEAPKLPPKPVREQARVLYGYEAQNEDELTIREGDVIVVLTKEVEDKGWWKGELNGRVGVFPDNFVKLIKEEGNEPNEMQPAWMKDLGKRNQSKFTSQPPFENKDVKVALPAKPERPEKSPGGKTVPKPDLPDKPAFQEYGNSSDRPVSKVPPFKPSEISKKASSPVTAGPEERAPERRPPPVPAVPGVPPATCLAAAKKPYALQSLPSPPAGGQQAPSQTPKKPPQRPPDEGSPPSSAPPPPPSPVASQPRAPAVPAKEAADAYAQVMRPAAATNGLAAGAKEPKSPPVNFAREEYSEATFDSIEPSENKLNHPTANRVRPPMNRRPPSHITVGKENGNEPNEMQPAWMKDLGKRNQSKFTSQPPFENKDVKVGSDNGPSTDEPREGDYSQGPPPKVPTVCAQDFRLSNQGSRKMSSSIDSETTEELRSELRVMRESSVSKEEFNDLLQQVNSLKETVESNRSQYSKLVRDLMTEIDEEKKLRMTLQVEIDRLKKLTLTV
ncbi:hypothetical protein IscW_ISCW020520 [Ixodes scapularis]|uniref:SH3 domain-containing protein n=1 Tax=Ixodes scapularis TaxID=6945 RepID=B7Q1G0_IXOSC|nr:hypothetical protein IscW_ISCW020520 [Ixodes scapularis]|eukprot:XP_002409600.1 hypothetical protein IscW_ISCW020520 [Ixodes scapularis]